MAKFRHAQTNFTGGEISPQAWGRTDQPWYPNAVKSLRNMIPMVAGGAYRRPGTYFDHAVDESLSSYPKLFPFIFSQDESYLVEMYTTYAGSTKVLKCWRPSSVGNLNRCTASTVTGTHPYEVAGFTSTSGYEANTYDDADSVQYAQLNDIAWFVHPLHKPKILTRTALDTFHMLDFDNGPDFANPYGGTALRDAWPYMDMNTSFTTLTPGATTGSNISLTAAGGSFTFQPGHVGSIFKIMNAAETVVGAMKITHYDSPTVVHGTIIVNFADTATLSTWWESAWSDFRGWPSSVVFFQNRILYGGTANAPNSIWCSRTFNFFNLSIFDDITPTSPVSAQTPAVIQTLKSDIQAGTATAAQTANYQALGGVYFGNNPFRIDMSGNQLNPILWMSSERTLIIGTTADEFVLTFTPNSTDSGFAADTYSCQVQTHYGSSYHQAVRAGNELFFCSRSDDELRALTFDFLQQQYAAAPLQNFYKTFPDIEPFQSRKKYRAFSWDKSRRTMWCIDTAGNLFALTRDKELQVAAWSSHQMGGFNKNLVGTFTGLPIQPAYLPAGSVVSIAVVPNPATRLDDIWLTVKRYVSGLSTFEYHVERMLGREMAKSSAFDSYFDAADTFTDASIAVEDNGSFTSEVQSEDFFLHPFVPSTDLYHLTGETIVGTAIVRVANTFYPPGLVAFSPAQGLFTMPDMVVNNSPGATQMIKPYPPDWDKKGDATFTNYAMVGLPFTAFVETLRIEAGSQIGSAQGAIKRIDELYIRFYRTLQAKFGVSVNGVPDPSTYELIQFRNGDTPMNQSPELFTGDYREKPMSTYDRDGIIVILQDKPLPFAILSISQRGESSDA